MKKVTNLSLWDFRDVELQQRKTCVMKRIRNIFISIMYLTYLRCRQLIYFGKRNTVYCTILFYHSIRDDEVLRFKKQTDIIKKLTTIIPLGYEGPFDNKVRYSIVTFDDAFKSVITNALPEMKNLEIPFTVFIPAG